MEGSFEYYIPDLSPKSPQTPKMLAQADWLRQELSDVLYQLEGGDVEDPTVLLAPLFRRYNKEVWLAALRSHHGDQDIPLCEFVKRGQHMLVADVLNGLPVDEEERKDVLEAHGQHGRTALQHAVGKEHWSCADRLIRHGANIGFRGDKLGIVANLNRHVRRQRKSSGSWRNMDRAFTDLMRTMVSLHGENWATRQPELDRSLYGSAARMRSIGQLSASTFAPTSTSTRTLTVTGSPRLSLADLPFSKKLSDELSQMNSDADTARRSYPDIAPIRMNAHDCSDLESVCSTSMPANVRPHLRFKEPPNNSRNSSASRDVTPDRRSGKSRHSGKSSKTFVSERTTTATATSDTSKARNLQKTTEIRSNLSIVQAFWLARAHVVPNAPENIENKK